MSRRVRVAAYGYFGQGNLGNDGTLRAFLGHLRRACPDVDVECLAPAVDVVERDHGVRTRRMMAYRAEPGRGGPTVALRKALGRLVDVPRTFWLVRGVDLLVVPGTGILETRLMARPWGMPYWLFLAALSTRLRRGRVALVSIGVEEAAHPLTRRLNCATLRLAQSCTFRDEGSRAAAEAMGVHDPGSVAPDLAFSLPAPAPRPPRPGRVVIGVMRFEGAPEDPDRGPHVVEAYTEKMSDVVCRLVAGGRTVTLVVGDEADHDLAVAIQRRGQADDGARAAGVRVSGASTLEALMEEMADAEVVVGSRYHNVVGALRAGRPTVSLGYAGKNQRLLARFGLGHLDQPIDDFDVDRLVGQIDEAAHLSPEDRDRLATALASVEAELADHLGTVTDLLRRG